MERRLGGEGGGWGLGLYQFPGDGTGEAAACNCRRWKHQFTLINTQGMPFTKLHPSKAISPVLRACFCRLVAMPKLPGRAPIPRVSSPPGCTNPSNLPGAPPPKRLARELVAAPNGYRTTSRSQNRNGSPRKLHHPSSSSPRHGTAHRCTPTWETRYRLHSQQPPDQPVTNAQIPSSPPRLTSRSCTNASAALPLPPQPSTTQEHPNPSPQAELAPTSKRPTD